MSNTKRIAMFFAGALLVGAAHAGQIADELHQPGNHELDTVATVTQGTHKYELEEFTCTRNAQLTAEDMTTERARAYGRWLAKIAAAHPNAKTMSVYAGAYDGEGCYERIQGGIRIYRPYTMLPVDVLAPIVASDKLGYPLAPTPTPAPMPAFEPSTAMSATLRAYLQSAPPGMQEDFIFETRPATMWQLTCKQAAQIQAGFVSVEKDRDYLRWQTMQPGNLLTVERVDGTFSESCYVPTSTGIRIFNKDVEPIDSNWQ
jgi:hypothetical protein